MLWGMLVCLRFTSSSSSSSSTSPSSSFFSSHIQQGFMYIYYTMESPLKGREEDRKLAKLLAVVGIVWGLGAPWIHFYAPIVFQGLFVLLVSFMVYKSFKYWKLCGNKTARRMFVFYHISVGASALIWVCFSLLQSLLSPVNILCSVGRQACMQHSA
jgi:hypothetical protein